MLNLIGFGNVSYIGYVPLHLYQDISLHGQLVEPQQQAKEHIFRFGRFTHNHQ